MQPGPEDQVVGVFKCNLGHRTGLLSFSKPVHEHFYFCVPSNVWSFDCSTTWARGQRCWSFSKPLHEHFYICVPSILWSSDLPCNLGPEDTGVQVFSKPLHEHYNICVPTNAWFSDLLGTLGQRSRLLKFSKLLHKHYDICAPSDV